MCISPKQKAHGSQIIRSMHSLLYLFRSWSFLFSKPSGAGEQVHFSFKIQQFFDKHCFIYITVFVFYNILSAILSPMAFLFWGCRSVGEPTSMDTIICAPGISCACSCCLRMLSQPVPSGSQGSS